MRILLDGCLPRELAGELIGHEVRTVQQQGWSGTRNGELLRRAAGSFAVFLTVDKRIGKSEQVPGDLTVVTIRAPSNRIQSLRPLVPQILASWKRSSLGDFTG